jgi:hypothetical protein
VFYKTGMALAVIEAKDNAHSVGAGMQQAIGYADLLSVPFSFPSNGDGFVFRDATLASGTLEKPRPRALALCATRRRCSIRTPAGAAPPLRLWSRSQAASPGNDAMKRLCRLTTVGVIVG